MAVKNPTSIVLFCLAGIGIYLGVMMQGGPDSAFRAGPFIRSFQETGNIGELLAMPGLGIAALGFIMMIIWRDGPSVGVFAVGCALSTVAAMTDSHSAGFDLATHSGALIKFAFGGVVLFFVFKYMFGRSSS